MGLSLKDVRTLGKGGGGSGGSGKSGQMLTGGGGGLIGTHMCVHAVSE